MKKSITSVFTRAASNIGIVRPLLTNAITGAPTGLELTILGTDSDAFRAARVERSRASAEILMIPTAEQADAAEAADRLLLASLVVGWNAEEPCTQENVILLFTESPAARDLVDITGGNRALFLPKS